MSKTGPRKTTFFDAAIERQVVLRALKVSAVVGTILMAINHGDVILAGDPIIWWKIILTYFVPYGVATYAAAMQQVHKG